MSLSLQNRVNGERYGQTPKAAVIAGARTLVLGAARRGGVVGCRRLVAFSFSGSSGTSVHCRSPMQYRIYTEAKRAETEPAIVEKLPPKANRKYTKNAQRDERPSILWCGLSWLRATTIALCE